MCADADLPPLISGATAVVLPSLYEGFGLPALEALACGAPLLAADASSLPEVTGDAALLLDPRDPAAWTAAMRRVLPTRPCAPIWPPGAGPRRPLHLGAHGRRDVARAGGSGRS